MSYVDVIFISQGFMVYKYYDFFRVLSVWTLTNLNCDQTLSAGYEDG